MRAEDIRGLSDDELTGRIAELERERFNLRFKSGTQALEDPLRQRVVRKELARLKTIRQERTIGVAHIAPVRAAKAAKTAKTTTKKAPAKRASARGGRRSGR